MPRILVTPRLTNVEMAELERWAAEENMGKFTLAEEIILIAIRKRINGAVDERTASKARD